MVYGVLMERSRDRGAREDRRGSQVGLLFGFREKGLADWEYYWEKLRKSSQYCGLGQIPKT